MKGLMEEIRRAEERYYSGQLISLFLAGIVIGTIVGWLLWG